MRYILASLFLLISAPVLAQHDIKQKLDTDTRSPVQTGWLIRAERSGVIAPAMVLPSDRNYKPLLRPKADSTATVKKLVDTPPMERIRVEPDVRPFTR